MSYKSDFEEAITELGMRDFRTQIDLGKLNEIRENATGMFFGGKAKEAAARAYRELILLNEKIVPEQKLDGAIGNLLKLKTWHFNGKVNVDLHFAIKKSVEEILIQYVGVEYEKAFYKSLSEMGIIVPITHDNFKTICLSYMFRGKREGMETDSLLIPLIRNVLKPQKSTYINCVVPEAWTIIDVVN